jgi:L-lactate dehydrogenase complex protein LldG
MSSREQVLGRIRAAIADVPAEEPALWSYATEPAPEADYVRDLALAAGERADLFAERCDDYRATVTRCADEPGAIRDAIVAAAARHGAHRLAIPADLDAAWVADTDLELLTDDAGRESSDGVGGADPLGLDIGALDGVDGALSGCLLAIALTGTIVLDADAGQGRRALTLIPDLHICVVRAEQIIAGVPEAVARMRASADAGRPLTMISGPSATSDIQLVRVEGVHGPRRLEVIVTTA